jgi:hypothetical protein
MVKGSMVKLLHRMCSYVGSFYGKVTVQNLFLPWPFLR